jgi:hypothetical protein
LLGEVQEADLQVHEAVWVLEEELFLFEVEIVLL